MQRRAVKKEDNKVFTKFVDTHDEKLLLRNHKKQVEISPRSSVKTLNPPALIRNSYQAADTSPFRSPRKDQILSSRWDTSSNRSRLFLGRSVEMRPESLRAVKLKNNLRGNLSPDQAAFFERHNIGGSFEDEASDPQ